MIQRWQYVQRLCDLITAGTLDVEKDADPIRRFLLWLNTWEPENKFRIVRTITYLMNTYPAHGLWDVFEFPQD